MRFNIYEKYLYYSFAYSLVIIAVFPVYWTLISSLKVPSELITSSPTFFPETFTLEYYIDVWNLDNTGLKEGDTLVHDKPPLGIGDAFLNSAIVSIGTIILSVILTTLTGYSLSMFQLPFKNLFFILLIFPILVPNLSLAIPLYKLLKDIGLLDTHWALIVIHTVAMLPLGTFMMRNAFDSIPKSLREISILEGAGELKIIVTVMLPLALPGLLTVMVFALFISWNDYLMAFIMTNKPEMTMLNVALSKIARGASQFEMKWGHLTAGSIISFLPIIIFYTVLQQYFVRGVTGSAVKE